MKIPMEWLNGKTVLTVEQVKALPVGATVWRHQCYGKLGEHMFVKVSVVKSGRSNKLMARDWKGDLVYYPIKFAENVAYTED